MVAAKIAAIAGFAAAASAQAIAGFNYGSTFTNNQPKQASDFQAEFTQAKNLVGTNGEFTSARLYTMIQAGTTNSATEALQAAGQTKTRLLLGMWASAGQAGFNNELAALQSAIQSFPQLASQIDGISVGSEDLYRITPTGIMNNAGVGAGPDVITSFIGQVRSALKGTAWSQAPVGHVDTYTAWINSSNDAVIQNSDFIGMDAYPYFQPQDNNVISQEAGLFNSALQQTINAAGAKPVWVTETGYPVSGPNSGNAVASIQNAQIYWDQVACPMLGKRNTWWYTVQDALPDTPSPSFGLATDGSTTPLYDLSCKNVKTNSTSSTSSSSSSAPTSSVPAKGQSSAPASSSAAPTSVVAAQSSGAASSTAAAAAGPSGSSAAAAPASSVSVAPASGGAATTPASSPAGAATPIVNNGAGRVGVGMGALAAVGAVAMLL